MNKSIKYLGFSFLGGLLLFTLGALRPFIASENGLAFGLTASNAVMVGSFRSMSGSVTNICADFATPQHVLIMPQTANTGEFDIGDPSQSTGRYFMLSKLSGTFLLGHDGTDAMRVNIANGDTTIGGGLTNSGNASFGGGSLKVVASGGATTVGGQLIASQGSSTAVNVTGGGGVTASSFNGGTFTGNGSGLTNLLNNNQLGTATWFGTAPATNVLIDLSTGTLFRFRATNNFTLIFTNGVDGQDFSVSIYQDATGNRTCPVLLSNNTGGTQTNRVAFGSDITGITLTTNALYWDHIKARFNVGTAGIPNTTNKIDIIGFVRGYN